MFSTNAKLNNNNNYFTSIYYFIFLLVLFFSCSCTMAVDHPPGPGYMQIKGYNPSTKKFEVLDIDNNKTFHIKMDLAHDVIPLNVHGNSSKYKTGIRTIGEHDKPSSEPTNQYFPVLHYYSNAIWGASKLIYSGEAKIYVKRTDIQKYLELTPAQPPANPPAIVTVDPPLCYFRQGYVGGTAANSIITIGATTPTSSATDIYLKTSNDDGAVTVFRLKALLNYVTPTIDKIIFKGNVYGASRTDPNNFLEAAIAIFEKIHIKDGIEIEASCTIKGTSAIDIESENLITNIINRGKLYGTTSAINFFGDLTGIFDNYGVIKGDNKSFESGTTLNPYPNEIHNHAGATIEGTLDISARKIENSGVIKGAILQSYATLTIENARYGKIQSAEIKSSNISGHIALNNAGEITVTGYISIDRNFTNSGTITQTDLNESFSLGSTNYIATNTGYIRAGKFSVDSKLINQAKGNMQLNEDLLFNAEVENYGIINATGHECLSFNMPVTNAGTLISPYGIFFGGMGDFYNKPTGKAYFGFSPNNVDINGVVNNQGGLYLTSHVDKVTITNYHGYNNSELVLTLPSTKPASLLTVTNNAVFDAGAKIILAAPTSLPYLQTPTLIKIVTTKKLTVAGSVEELLYSRAYDTNNNIVKADEISSNSMLINITNVKAYAIGISARLQMAKLSDLKMLPSDLKIMTSLLNNDIAYSLPKILKTTTQSIITTANPTSYYDYYTTNRIAIGSKNGKIGAIYATSQRGYAVEIFDGDLSPIPTIDKITLKANIYGALQNTPNALKYTAISMYSEDPVIIKDGIEIDHGCTIQGAKAIHFVSPFTTNIINRGRIVGTSYSFYDKHVPNDYEIHNQAGATIEGRLHISVKKLKNSGTIKGGIEIQNSNITIENKPTGKMLCTQITLVDKKKGSININNAGEINVSSEFQTKNLQFTNAKAATLTVKGFSLFTEAVTNDGLMVFQGINKFSYNVKFYSKLTNSGTIITTTGAMLCDNDITNFGIMNIFGMPNAAQTHQRKHSGFLSEKLDNSGTIILHAGVLLIKKSSTNTGIIIVKKDLDNISFKAVYNLYNSGYIKAKAKTRLLSLQSNITNTGHFITAGIKVYQDPKRPGNSCFNNQTKNAIAEFTDIFHEPHINIDNQGSLLLQGSTTIGSYSGNANSELVLNLLANKPNALLKVTNDATFTQGAKIVLAALQPTFLSQNPQNVTILTASKLTAKDSATNLLHSGTYDTSQLELSSKSVLIKITNAKKTATDITANLQIDSTAISTIDLSQFTVVRSLLSRKKTSTTVKKPQVIITAYPVKCYDYYKTNKTNKTIDIGKTSRRHTPQDIYAKGNNPAVLIINPKLSPVPTIDKINFTGNVYGALRSSSSFNKIAVVIKNTKNMQIKNGIEVTSSCTIKGKIAIEFQDELTANIINRGTISGTKYSINDNLNLTSQKYEIYNQAGATIEGELNLKANRIENSGVIKGRIFQSYVNLTIENKHSGKIHSSDIICKSSALNLINDGEITVTGSMNISGSLTNSGTIEQTNLSKNFNLGDRNNQSYTVANTGYISGVKLISYASITNSGTIMLTSAELKNNTKVSNLSYIQVTNDFTTGPNTSFNNSGTAQLITTSGNIDFKGIADNSAIIIASNNLTTDVKKFTNTGSISIGSDATFGAGGVENSATITVSNRLKAGGLFENKAQGMVTIAKGNAEFGNLHNYTNATITVTAGMLTFNKPTTNSGYITANNITTKHIAFTNNQTAQLITTIGGITFGGVVNNSATIISADAIIASTHKFTNSGTVISNKGACKFDDIDNNSGVITIKGSAETSKAVNNTGTITIEKAYTANDVFNNTSPGVVTLGSLTGTQYLVAQFTKKLTNSGTITAINRLEIAKTGQVDNSGVINAQHGLTSEAEFTNTNTVNVTGATNFKGKFINQSQATLTVTGGLAQFTHGYNSGTIHALKGFTTSGFTNSPGSRLKVENADLNISGGSLLNLGSIDIQQSHHLVLHRESRLLNGKHATVNTSKIIISEIAAAFFEAPLVSKMQIENHYILSLQAGSTVKDYIGYASSELSLALPNKSLGNTALLTTTNDASFSIGAKIILDATGQLGYLSSPASLTIYIITANNKLTTGLTTAASLESSLLYSRVYSSEVSHTLHSGSIFIKISEVTITNKSKSLTAKLQLTTPAKLGMKTLGTTKHIGLARSLYQNDILNGAMASTIRPQGSPYPDGYVNNRANKQIIETKGLVALGTFTNPAGFNIMAGGGKSSFLGDVTNIGTIKALSGLELTKTAKFINLTTGILTVDTPKTISGSIFEAIFRGELSNQGTINAKSGLETNLFINFQGATLTSGGLWQLLGDATNSGAINANAELELTKTAKFVNLKSGSITIAKQATFSGEASNAGTINADADLTINKFTNSRAATLTIGGNWQLTGETTNAGTIYVKADLGERTATTAMTNSKLTNLEHGSICVSSDAFFNGRFANKHTAIITVNGYARFDGASINSGIMHLHNASMYARFDNRRGAILYNYGNDSIGFHQDAFNNGTINTPRLTAYAKFTNLQHGSITVSTSVAEFIGEASNAGTINALADLQVASFTNSKDAILTVKGLANFNQVATNDGYIYAYKDLTVAKQFTNLQHGSITIGDDAIFNDKLYNAGSITITGYLELNQHATNDGYIHATRNVQLADNITLTNRKHFIAKKVTTKGNHSNTYTQFNNLADSSQAVVATAEVIDDFTEPYLNIDNQSSLFLRGLSTIGNYTGNITSELVLALPAGTAPPTSPLLTVQHEATFTQGSKIILTADAAVKYLRKPTSINIVTAGGKLVVDGDRADRLLYSRAYDVANHTVIKKGSPLPLATNSVLICITQATADSTHITADLQIANAQALGIDLATLVDSLLKNKIISAENERMAKPAIIITADPVKFYNYKNNAIAIGKPANQPAATIYATKTSVTAVAIGAYSLALPKLDKIAFVADVIGAVSTTLTKITKDAVIIYGASTSEVSQGIDIQPASYICGKRGIVIDASLTANINNQGIIDGADYAIYFAGDGCILNGNIINQGTITSKNYALYSDPNNKITLIGARRLVVENKKTGLISGSITVSGTASLVNYGAVNSVDIAIANILNFGNITNGNKQTALHIIAEVSNTGSIEANNKDSSGIGLEVTGSVYNLDNGNISVTTGKSVFAKVTNSGIIIAAGSDANSIGFSAKDVVYNYGSITVTTGDLKLNNNTTNDCYINAAHKTILTAGKHLANKGYFVTSSIIVISSQASPAYFDNIKKDAIAEFTDIINETTLNIDNQGSLLLQGSSIIGNYISSASSELVLNIPATKPSALLKVANVASFAQGSKIILATTKSTFLTQNTQSVTIITANKIKVGGDVDKLLYSRTYNGNTIIKTGKLTSNSVLIEITNASKQATKITANLRLASTSVLNINSQKVTLVDSLLKDKIISAANEKQAKLTAVTTKKITVKTKPSISAVISNIDVSGVEFYKPIDNHFMITKDIATDYNTRLIQQQQVRNRFYDYNIYEPKYNIRTYIARRNGNDKQHNWHEMVLSVGGVSEINTTTFGFTFVYLANKLATNNLPKTDIDGYHGIAYISYDLNGISLSASGIYGVTNYKNKNITGKHTNEFSLDVATSYRFIVEDISINLGVDSKFIGVNLSSHSYKDTANKVTNKDKSFISLGCFIEIATFKRFYHIFSDIGKVNASLHSSYTYITGIASNDNIIIIDANNNSKAISQDKLNNHRFYTTLKTQLDYNNWFYSLSLDYSKKAHQNIYGANIAVGYIF